MNVHRLVGGVTSVIPNMHVRYINKNSLVFFFCFVFFGRGESLLVLATQPALLSLLRYKGPPVVLVHVLTGPPEEDRLVDIGLLLTGVALDAWAVVGQHAAPACRGLLKILQHCCSVAGTNGVGRGHRLRCRHYTIEGG